jgi:hypothetical protein
MPALSTDSPTPSDAALTPIERARAAAEARAQRPPPSSGPPVSTSEQAHSPLLQPQDFNPSRADVLPFHRLLDSEVSLTSSSRPTLKRELTLSPPLSCSRSAQSRKRSRLSIRSPPSSPTSCPLLTLSPPPNSAKSVSPTRSSAPRSSKSPAHRTTSSPADSGRRTLSLLHISFSRHRRHPLSFTSFVLRIMSLG